MKNTYLISNLVRPSKMVRLSDLNPGQRGKILAIEGNDYLSCRLQEMGLLEGDEVEVLTWAPLGDPIEIRVGDSLLSLRKIEAQRVILAQLGNTSRQ